MTCTKKTQTKYITRNSPAYSASDCEGMRKKGNDGSYYTSTPDKNGTYKWVKSTITTKTKTKSKTAKNKTAKSSTKQSAEITMEEIQKIIKKNRMSKSGTKLELAQTINRIVKMDKEFGTRHIYITESEKTKIADYVSKLTK
jgi:hypothetical protein